MSTYRPQRGPQNKRRSNASSKSSNWKSAKFNRSSSNWKSSNRSRFKQKIDHSVYISQATEFNAEPAFIAKNTFNDFNLQPQLKNNISAVKYELPTKIQDEAIPQILQGKDVLGIASTGSGKTAAFLIPLIDKAMRDFNSRVLIICPTRELANQINNEFRKFAQNTELRMVVVIGGSNISTQVKILQRRPQFVVATPGRLMDLEKRKCINLMHFNNVVLDEVDQMLDMGFVDDIKAIIAKLPENRQSLFFSATMARKEEDIANTLLKDPIKLQVHKQSPLKSISQSLIKVQSRQHKMEKLHELLKQTEFSKVLVFSSTKAEADNISTSLRKVGIRVESLHGDKSQFKRTKVLGLFRQDKIDVLVATDVAARGIDVPDITHVINYDEPSNVTDYIHRIGRTGRVGKTGTAVTFVLER